MQLALPLSLLLLPILITSNAVDPVTPPQELLAAAEDPRPAKWQLKSFPNFPCSGADNKLHSGTSKTSCTVLADTPSKGYRFFSTSTSFKVCFYNQKGCAKDNFCGSNFGSQKCSPIGNKGPAVSFKIVNGTEKCTEGGSVIGQDHDDEVEDELDTGFFEL